MSTGRPNWYDEHPPACTCVVCGKGKGTGTGIRSMRKKKGRLWALVLVGGVLLSAWFAFWNESSPVYDSPLAAAARDFPKEIYSPTAPHVLKADATYEEVLKVANRAAESSQGVDVSELPSRHHMDVMYAAGLGPVHTNVGHRR